MPEFLPPPNTMHIRTTLKQKTYTLVDTVSTPLLFIIYYKFPILWLLLIVQLFVYSYFNICFVACLMYHTVFFQTVVLCCIGALVFFLHSLTLAIFAPCSFLFCMHLCGVWCFSVFELLNSSGRTLFRFTVYIAKMTINLLNYLTPT